MCNYYAPCKGLLGILVLLLFAFHANAQTSQQLKIKDFAIWGGSGNANSFDKKKGVFIDQKVTITGNVGSNHQVETKKDFNLTGNIFSGNVIKIDKSNTITGNITASNQTPNLKGKILEADEESSFFGNLIINGLAEIKDKKNKASVVSGYVRVPAPTNSNYSGPIPTGGISNNVVLPLSPIMPNNTPFDNNLGTIDITGSRIITPGTYRNMELKGKGNKVTFSGPGNYIFYSIKNSGDADDIIFDFKGTTEGVINIFVIDFANWGKANMQTINGNANGRIYTEVHGDGKKNGGNAFEISGKESNWFGTVWAPFGDINIKADKATILGALWSGTAVNISKEITLNYQNLSFEPNFIVPYYPPPVGGKVSPANNIIGADLFSLSQNPNSITTIPDNINYRIQGTGASAKVMIEVISKTAGDAALLNQLVAAGMTNFAGVPGVIDNGPHTFVITGYFPINLLTTLNNQTNFPGIRYVRPLYPPITNVGQVTSQGDATMRSDKVRERFGLDGSGIKVGVLSDSYNSQGNAQNDVNDGDLPGTKTNGQPSENPDPVEVLFDLPFEGHDEGRAMLQIVHDVAPKSKLAFRTGFLTAGDFAKGIIELSNPALAGGKCDVIVDDITYVTEPFLQDGIVANTVNQVVGQGVTYFSSAGNFGERSYENTFQGVTNLEAFPAPATIHKFGVANSEIYQTVTLKPGTYTIVLQWSDNFHSLGNNTGVQTDLDLYLIGANGFRLFGFNRSNLFGDPFEVCPFTVKEETEMKVMIVNANGTPSNVKFKYIIFRGDGKIVNYQNGASTVVGHPNAKGCIAVGAMLYANIPQYTPVWPAVASFSSRGGTNTLEIGGGFLPRNKPDLIGPNGANTTVNLGGPVFDDGDAYPNFFGTSAAAPHVAAVAALIAQGKKKYGLQTVVTPAEIRTTLQNTAGKLVGQTGFNFEGGYGYVQADSAVATISNPRPSVSEWLPNSPALVPNGTTPFPIKIIGKYLTPNTQIYFKGLPIPTVVSADKTEATGIIPVFPTNEDPAIQLYNPSKSASELDGGLSESLHFFSTKKDVTIRAEDISKKYGQANPGLTVEVLIDGVPINQTTVTLADLKLDGNNLSLITNATTASGVGLYGIFASRTTPLNPVVPADAAIISNYGFTFVSGTMAIGKMPLKITPNNKTVKYGDYIGDITFDYLLNSGQTIDTTLRNEIRSLHKKFMADNALAVINGFSANPNLSIADLANMAAMTSFQSVRNARKFSLQNGQLQAIVNTLPTSEIGNQRFIVDVAAQSLSNYKTNPAQSNMVEGITGENERALLSIKSLANGVGKAALSNGQLQPMVNGQLLAMVNGQLQAIVNGQLQALVNGVWVAADDIVFRNGQLLAMVNGQLQAIVNGQLQAIVNSQSVTVELSINNGQLQAIVNGQLMALVNGQLQAIVNGQLLAIVNGQLQAMVNGQLMPMVNGQLLAMVNGQLQAIVNGQLLALVNGQLMALVNGELQKVQSLSLSNGQLQALVNGQLQALVNGQLKAMVNSVVTDIPTTSINLVNGQLQALVNGQLQAMVNGQLQAIVNGQLQPLVNGELVAVESVRQLANGQLQALVNGQLIPMVNGQLQALVNGQLLAMVNGQLMAIVNNGGVDELTFAVFTNGQLQALVNGQLQPMVNGQLQAMVNGQLQALVNNTSGSDNTYQIANGQLQAIVNGANWNFTNGQLLALVNGQLQAIVNNFNVSGAANNANTVAVVDEDDINLQGGSLGGMFAVNMITGLNVGTQKLIPGAFVNDNYEVSYGLGEVAIEPRVLVVKAKDTAKVYGATVPTLTMEADGFSYGQTLADITAPSVSTTATAGSNAGNYPITLSGGNAGPNYNMVLQNGVLTITRKSLTVTADDKTKLSGDTIPALTISYNGLVNGDTENDICVPLFVTPASPVDIQQLNRKTTYSNVQLNGQGNVLFATPGQSVSLTYDRNSVYNDPNEYCPGCITQLQIGMTDGNGGNTFADCSDAPWAPINRSFIAPTTPGVYYITQHSEWWYYCGQFGVPVHGNNPIDAIAVVIVQSQVSGNGIVASTNATASSPSGNYPITLSQCNSLNYDVTYVNGTLSVSGVAPVVNCPANITVNSDAGQCSAIVNFSATETTGSPASTITYSHAPGSSFPVGTTFVTATATNAIGSSICTFTITVVDNSTYTCPANISVSNDPGQCSAVVNIPLQTSTTCGQIVNKNIAGFTYLGIYNGSAYYTSNTNAVWNTANNNAIAQGGHLATISSLAENQFIVANAPAAAYYIGINDIATEGTFVWTNGEPVTYTNWDFRYGQQPDNYLGLEDVTVLKANDGGYWNDVPVTDSWRYILEFSNVGGVREQTSGLASGSAFPVGTTTNTYVTTDRGGVQHICDVSVTVVKDPTDPGASGCVPNIVLDGIQNLIIGDPNSNGGNVQSDYQWQSFKTGNNSTYLDEINVNMTRYSGYNFMRARIYQGVGLGGSILGTLDIASYNGGVIDFSSLNGGSPLQLQPNTSYTLLMNGDLAFDNNYIWDVSNAEVGDPLGSTSGATLKMTVKLESCETNIVATAPYITGVGPEGTAISFNGSNYAIDNSPRVPESGPYTVSFWAKQTTPQNNLVEMLSQGRNLYIGHEPYAGYDDVPNIGTVTSASRSGRALTGITYDIITSPSTTVSKTTTASEFIKSKLVLSSLTANPVPGSDANRFWFTGKTTLTETEALSVTGDLDLGTVLQDCADPGGVNHTVLFDKKIYPGEGPEIFIVHGGLSGNFEILDQNGDVALTIPYDAGNPVIAGGSVFTSLWSPAFYLRDNNNFSVEALSTHFNSQNGIIAIDIRPGDMEKISGIRFGGGGCNYTYEILGVQPDVIPYEMRIGDFNNTNVGYPQDGLWHNYALVRDVAGNNTHLYLDGELVHSKGSLIASPTISGTSPNNFILGAQWSTNEKFIGNLDEVRIFNYAMTAGEIQCNQTNPLSGAEAGLVGYYNFQEAGGTQVNNAGSSGGSLTIQNPTGSDRVKSIEVIGMFDGIPLNPSNYYSITSLPDYNIYWTAPGYNNGQPICTTSITTQPSGSCVILAERSNGGNIVQQELKELPKTIVYPNPTTNSVKVQVPGQVLSANNVRVYDMVGKMQVVKRSRLITENLLELDVSNLPTGVYFIRVMMVEGEKTLKFVKM